METIAVSVIIPAYNAEKYLERCLESLLCQTLQDFEIIIVNDGSVDDTQNIIDQYSEAYPGKVVGFSQENSGPSVARNLGIEHAKGEFIGFADADDWVSPYMLELMYQKAVEKDADLVVCGRYDVIIKNGKEQKIKRRPVRKGLYGESIFTNPALLECTTQFIWDKLFRREILIEQNIRFSSVFRYTEDVLFLCIYKYYCRKISLVSKLLCYHDISDRNVMKKYGRKVLDVPAVLECVFQFYENKGCFEEMEPALFELSVKRYMLRIDRYPYLEEKRLQYEYCAAFFDIFEKHFSDWKRRLRYYRITSKSRAFRNSYRTSRIGMRLYIAIPNKIKRSYRKFKKKYHAEKKKFAKIRRKLENVRKSGYYYHLYYKKKLDPDSVLIESKSGKDLAGNMFRILEETLKNYQKKIYLVVHPSVQDSVENLIKNYNLPRERITFIIQGSKKYFYALATAGFLFNDSAFPPRFVKKEGQIYTNTWHGTPLKNMGRDVPARVYAIGAVQRNLLTTDYLVYPNEYMKEKMVNAYMLNNLYKGTILNEGYPRNAVFFDEERRESLRRELGLVGKRVYVYMPTWRGVMTAKKNKKQWQDTATYFQEIDELLEDDQIFYVKMHLYASRGFSLEDYRHIKPFPTGFETYDFLNMVDCLVTDYSSVFYDFANSGKKIVLFTYDEEEFFDERGVYMQLEELPFPKAKTAKELVDELNQPKNYTDTQFRELCCTYDNKHSAQRLCQHIYKKEKVCNEEKLTSDGKENVVIYARGLERTARTFTLLKLMEESEKKNKHYYISFIADLLKKKPFRLTALPSEVGLLPLSDGPFYTFWEAVYYVWYVKRNHNSILAQKYIKRLFEREWKKYYGNARIDTAVLFVEDDYSHMEMFEQFPGKKVFVVGNPGIYRAVTRTKNIKKVYRKACLAYSKVLYLSETEELPELPEKQSEGISFEVLNIRGEQPGRQFDQLL